MNGTRLDGITQGLVTVRSRRGFLGRALFQGAAALGVTLAGTALLPDEVAARKLCRKNGSRCKHESKRCKPRFCRVTSSGSQAPPNPPTPPGPQPLTIQAPFTIEAVWTSPRDHDTYFFVPNETGANLPSPFIDYSCNSSNTACETEYPFVCVNQDATGPGDEITTVTQLLDGT